MIETVHPARWPNFPGETDGRNLAIADIEALDEVFQAPRDPDWTAITNVFKAEESAAFKEADKSPIYDYEIEIQRTVPSLEEPIVEKEGWRERAKRVMGKASDALREVSASTLATAQAKTEQFYGDKELGTKRKKITGAVAGALVLGATTYLSSKGLVFSGGSSPMRAVERAVEAKVTTANHFGFTAFQHVAHAAPHHHEHVRQATEVTLHSGSNPWHVTEAQLHAHGVAHPSDARIAADDARLLKLNHISPLQAMKMHVGDKLKLLKVW